MELAWADVVVPSLNTPTGGDAHILVFPAGLNGFQGEVVQKTFLYIPIRSLPESKGEGSLDD